jgi:DNA-binding winged helix-turn-helix (wHTH) protein
MTTDWFRGLMDTAPEVYFRYVFAPTRRFVYVSRAIETLTGHKADAFYSDAAFCVSLVYKDDRGVLRQIVRARRGLATAVRLQHRDGPIIRVALRTVPVVRGKRVIAVEGVAWAIGSAAPVGFPRHPAASEPVQQRLAALLYEVHDLLHSTLPPRSDSAAAVSRQTQATMTLGDIVLDSERMTVTLAGELVALTSREVLLLRYFLQRPERVVTRQQLLADVWGHRYSGDDRTVDVHVSRLRHKLPPLRTWLHAVKHIGYRLDRPDATSDDTARIANN